MEAIGLDGEADKGNADALELLVVGIPGLQKAAFALEVIVGLAGFKPVELALVLPLELPRPAS